MFTHARHLPIVLTALSMIVAGGPNWLATRSTVSAVSPPSPDVVAAVTQITRSPNSVSLPPLPVDPIGALITALTVHSARIGHPGVNHGPAIMASVASGMSLEFAGRLALLMRAVLECPEGPTALAAQRLACAVAVNAAAAGVMRAASGPFRDLQAWPSLFVDGDRSNDYYVHDYSVLIDRGGTDVYENNAGGNLQDVKFGPAGSAGTVGKAIGCEIVQGNFPAPTATAHDCIAAPQVVLIDMGTGNDTYGVFRAPRQFDHNPPLGVPPTARTVDGQCTNDRLIRRIVLEGSGFQGNGLLIDQGGNDRYYGKTAAQGSGHSGGIGVLRDLGSGNDEYYAIRNSQGFSLVGVLGLLQDDGGNDWYHTYMPRPTNRNAAFQELGSGGVVDDTGLCDNLPRMVQGAALLGGTGVLMDQNGRDVYVGAPVGTQPFQPGVLFFHSSQGFGCDGGVGVLADQGADRDRYLEGPEGRSDGVSITRVETDCVPAPPGLSRFLDDGR